MNKRQRKKLTNPRSDKSYQSVYRCYLYKERLNNLTKLICTRTHCIACGTPIMVIADYREDEQILVCAHCGGPEE